MIRPQPGEYQAVAMQQDPLGFHKALGLGVMLAKVAPDNETTGVIVAFFVAPGTAIALIRPFQSSGPECRGLPERSRC